MSLLCTSAHLLTKIPYFIYTCFLFTKSDIKTTVIPVVRRGSWILGFDPDTDFDSHFLERASGGIGSPKRPLSSAPHRVLGVAARPAIRCLQPDNGCIRGQD